MHKLTDADLDQFLAENPPWSGLAQSREESHAHPCD